MQKLSSEESKAILESAELIGKNPTIGGEFNAAQYYRKDGIIYVLCNPSSKTKCLHISETPLEKDVGFEPIKAPC